MAEGDKATVLVTGGTGFVALHCVRQLLLAGYQVRTTVRSLEKGTARIIEALRGPYVEPPVPEELLRDSTDSPEETDQQPQAQAQAVRTATRGALRVYEADILPTNTPDAVWDAAVSGCTFVLHVASPFPLSNPKHEDELIKPAVEGTTRVLQAVLRAREAYNESKLSTEIKRVVLTSSIAAITYGHAKGRVTDETVFDETWWSDLQGMRNTPYIKSKLLAEKAARKFMEDFGDKAGLQLVSVNPSLVLGTSLSPSDRGASVELIRRFITGGFPIVPRISIGVVDVADVAELHLLAMTHPQAAGQRYFCVVGGKSLGLADVAALLREGLKERLAALQSESDPTPAEDKTRLAGLYEKAIKAANPAVLPNAVAYAASYVVPELRGQRNNIGLQPSFNNDKACKQLGWAPRSAKDAITDTAVSLIRGGQLA